MLILTVSAALTLGVVASIRAGAMPLGVRGEWEWLRVPFGPSAYDLIPAVAGVGVYAVFAGLVQRALARRTSRVREVVAVFALLGGSVAVQAVAQSGAPVGYGLAKWVIALQQKGPSGYFQAAKTAVLDPGGFFAQYPEWIKHQDALHIGTHPPGLIAVETGLLWAFERSPGAARIADDHAPETVTKAFRFFGQEGPASPADRATIVVTGSLTLVLCAATVVPLYGLARVSLTAPAAWSAAAVWPLVPSAVLFQPTADTAFPFLSTSAFALAASAGVASRWPGRLAALAGGVVLGVGMQFTLAFLAVGLIVAVVLVTSPAQTVRERLVLVGATGAGFLGLTLAVWVLTRANPFVIWWWNQKNHARFYVEFPRNRLAWTLANPIELAVGLGIPVAVWALAGFARPRGLPRVAVASALVLAFLTLSGKSLSEVARLWLPFMPALVVAAGAAMERLSAGPKSLVTTILLLGAQTLALQATIQVVYPV